MNRFESLRPETGEAGAPSRLVRHIPSQLTSYDAGARKVKQPRRVRYPNLSPTTPPAVAADAAFWPAWTDLTITELGFSLVNQENGGAY